MVISGLIPFEPFHSSSKFLSLGLHYFPFIHFCSSNLTHANHPFPKALTNADDVELKDLIKLHEASQPIEIVDYMLVFENTKHPSFKEKETKILEEAATRYQAPARTSVLKVVDLPENLECDANKVLETWLTTRLHRSGWNSRENDENTNRPKVRKAVKEAEMAEVAQTENNDDVNEVALFSKSKQKTSKDIEKVKQLIMTKLADRRIAFDEQKSVDGKNILLRLSAIFEALCIEAERLHIKRFSKKKVTNDDKFGDIPFGDSLIPQVAISVERVAAQFAFNEYLIKSLSILALVGIVVFVLDQLVDVVIIFVRSSIFDRLWRRKNARSLYDTNSLKPTEPDMIRPVFIGRYSSQTSPATPNVSTPPDSNAIFLALSIAGQWATVFYEADLVSTFHVQADSEAVLFLVRCKPGLINGVLQMVLWSLYGRVASRSGKSVQRGRALQAAHSSCEHPPHPPVPEEGARTHCHWQSDRECPCVEETSTNTTLRTEEEGAVKNLDDDQSRFNTPTPGMDLMSQDLGRKKVEEEGQAVHQNDCGATRADAGAAGEAEGVQEYENEYNKRMSEVEFEQSKEQVRLRAAVSGQAELHPADRLHSDLALSSLVALISGVLDTLSARYKLLNTKQHPIPSTRPNTSWMETSITTIIWASIPLTTLELYYCFRAKLTDLFTGGYTPTTADNAAFVFFIQFLAALALENLFLAVRAAIALSTASAQIDTEFGAIKLKVGFILIFDDIIGLKMQQSIYLRSEGLTYQMESEKELPIRLIQAYPHIPTDNISEQNRRVYNQHPDAGSQLSALNDLQQEHFYDNNVICQLKSQCDFHDSKEGLNRSQIEKLEDSNDVTCYKEPQTRVNTSSNKTLSLSSFADLNANLNITNASMIQLHKIILSSVQMTPDFEPRTA
ncbi:hypothetical protein BLNAU_5045 [Blattamonas nauphoetae]|uniref:Anoctamin transmembrane domain-containing protein n=1 Tax=Blattamonas nauphoetae TaxID=2049346 RepID=A0ABQ9Y7V8_9EUKA|nr:hypothetical protein BLNAU_5045 [Blattamonas nauphoetae]